MKPWQWLAIVVAVHALLAAAYAAFTPYRTGGKLFAQGGAYARDIGAPDERQHANYVQHLLDGRGLPVLDPKDAALYENYQSHQPPLFYVLAAGWAKLFGVDQVAEQGSSLPLRSLNIVIGAIGLIGVFYIGKWGFADDRIGLLAAAIAGWLPMSTALSGAFSNDPLLIALCSWGTAYAVLSAKNGPALKTTIVLGALTGAAVLTKTTGLALVPLALLALVWSPGKKRWGLVALYLGVVGVLAGPWWIRNFSVYGDPLAMGAFNQAFTGTMQAATGIAKLGVAGYWLQVAQGTAASFVGVFGYWDVWFPEPIYQAWSLVLLAGILAGLYQGLRAKESSTWLAAVFILVVALLFVRFNLQYFQAQGRYLYPAIGAIAALFARGLVGLNTKKQWLPIACCVALLFTNQWMLTQLPSEFKARTEAQPAGTEN